MSILCSMDPGSSGAFVKISTNFPFELIDIIDYPKLENEPAPASYITQGILNTGKLEVFLRDVDYFLTEKPFVLNKDYPTTAARYAFYYASVISIIHFLKIPIQYILPKTWQGSYGIKVKEESMKLVQEMSQVKEILNINPSTRIRHDVCDAVLIAMYGAKNVNKLFKN
ncbi:MAG: hypothetical protein QXL94_04060 [Candidatus Parvarchaeum sp.]